MTRIFLTIVAVITLSAAVARGEDELVGVPDEDTEISEILPDTDSDADSDLDTGDKEVTEIPQPLDPDDKRTNLQKVGDRWYAVSGREVAGYFKDNDFSATGFKLMKMDGQDFGAGASHYDTISHLLDYSANPAPGMNGAQARSALGSYTGYSYANSAQAVHSNVRSMNRGVIRHIDDINKTLGESEDLTAVQSSEDALASLFGSKSSGKPHRTEDRFWVGGIVNKEELRTGSDGSPGYKYSGTGLLMGYDHTIDVLSIGGAFGYSGGKFKDRTAIADDSRIESRTATVYATYNPEGKFRALAYAGYGRSDVRLRKNRAGMAGSNVVEGFERSKYGMDTYSLGGRVGYETDFKDIIKLGVTGGVNYQYSRGGAFNAVFETNNLSSNSTMQVGPIRNNTLSIPIDLTADYVLLSDCDSSLTVSANVGYEFERSNKGAHGTLIYDGLNTQSVRFSARSPGRNGANLGLGLMYENDRMDVTAKYDTYLRSDYTQHQLTGNMGIKF